jgi:hypothetical protein
VELYDRALAARPRRVAEAGNARAADARPAHPRPVEPLPIVVGFRRTALDEQLAPMPADLRDRLTVLTTERPGADRELPPAGWTLAADETVAGDGAGRAPASGVGRLVWLARHPLVAIRRRVAARRRPSERLERRREIVRRVVGAMPGEVTILALDGDDLLAVEGVLDDRVTLAAGGLRWLADAWDGGRSASASESAAGSASASASAVVPAPLRDA